MLSSSFAFLISVSYNWFSMRIAELVTNSLVILEGTFFLLWVVVMLLGFPPEGTRSSFSVDPVSLF